MTAFAPALLAWFERAAADLPWRRRTDPYAVWLSEIMLQQTQVNTVIPYYERFLAAYPTVWALAAASLDEVLRQWEGLGYYSRARNLHRAARQIAAQHDGQFPHTAAALQKLPGIGRYTANAIASMAFGEAVAVLDGNVIRVLARLHDVAEDVAAGETQRRLWALAQAHAAGVAAQRIGDYNQALMELGRKVCKPRRPLCADCPIQAHCAAYAQGTQTERPVKRRRPSAPHYDHAAAIITDANGSVLVVQRPAEGLLGGLWEFPNVRAQPGETPLNALHRWAAARPDLRLSIGETFLQVHHAFTHFRMTLHAVACRYGGGPVQGEWVSMDRLERYAFPRAERKVIEFVVGRAGRLF